MKAIVKANVYVVTRATLHESAYMDVEAIGVYPTLKLAKKAMYDCFDADLEDLPIDEYVGEFAIKSQWFCEIQRHHDTIMEKIVISH